MMAYFFGPPCIFRVLGRAAKYFGDTPSLINRTQPVSIMKLFQLFHHFEKYFVRF